ncbi:MAG: PepSY-like domain-containing protein [Bacteroidota bacterium]
MKKTAVTMVVMLLATLTFAQKMQEKNVPANVKFTFHKKYPTATEVKWDKEGKKYEASFDLNKIDNSVLMDAQGNIIETEIEIELTQLPKGILEYVRTHYTGKQAKEGAKITNAKEGIVTYEVEIKGMDLIFDSNGKFIKESKG